MDMPCKLYPNAMDLADRDETAFTARASFVSRACPLGSKGACDFPARVTMLKFAICQVFDRFYTGILTRFGDASRVIDIVLSRLHDVTKIEQKSVTLECQ